MSKQTKDYIKLYWHMHHKCKLLEDKIELLNDSDTKSKYDDLLSQHIDLIKKNKLLQSDLDGYKIKKYNGKIVRLSKNLDFGFIQNDDYDDIFFHRKNTNKISLNNNDIGCLITFNIIHNEKGYNAVNVHI